MRISEETKREQYRIIYEALYGIPRIYLKDLAEKLRIDPRAAGNRLREACDQEYIVGPGIRKRSFRNLSEYMYFVNCKDPELLYMKLREDPRVVYHAKASGFCNLWITARERMNIEGDVLVEGCRSDCFIPYTPNRSWGKALEIITRKIDTFDPTDYQPKESIKTHLDQTIEWDNEDETLYRYFKYNLRKSLEDVMKRNLISCSKLYNFLGRLPETCTIALGYYPDTLRAYDSYLFMFDTHYEDFIIDLFSEFPASVLLFKVSNKLLAFASMPWQVIRNTDLGMTGQEVYIPYLLVNLGKKGIINNKEYTIVEYYWRKSL